MLPLSDDNRGRRRPPVVTWTFIAINVVLFLYEQVLSTPDLARLFNEYGVIPSEISAGGGLLALITSMFLHGGWLHVIGNMLFLWVFGDNVEDVMGHVRYLTFYVITGVSASLVQVFVNPDSMVPLIGASGAISGVLAAYIVCFPRGKILTLVTLGIFITSVLLPAWIMIGYWIVLQVVQGSLSLGVDAEAGGVAFFAHIGGFAIGLALVVPFRKHDRVEYQRAMRNQPAQQRQRVGWGKGARRG